jgi:hypothetical protein
VAEVMRAGGLGTVAMVAAAAVSERSGSVIGLTRWIEIDVYTSTLRVNRVNHAPHYHHHACCFETNDILESRLLTLCRIWISNHAY